MNWYLNIEKNKCLKYAMTSDVYANIYKIQFRMLTHVYSLLKWLRKLFIYFYTTVTLSCLITSSMVWTCKCYTRRTPIMTRTVRPITTKNKLICSVVVSLDIHGQRVTKHRLPTSRIYTTRCITTALYYML